MDLTKDGLADAGFEGFKRLAQLKARGGCSCVPPCHGIYAVLRCSSAPPTFLLQSVGGNHKGKNPTVAANMLEANWVPGATILYIGKAGDEGQATTLNRRVSAYMSFGRGARASHWGGRLVWQLGIAMSCCSPGGRTTARASRSSVCSPTSLGSTAAVPSPT